MLPEQQAEVGQLASRLGHGDRFTEAGLTAVRSKPKGQPPPPAALMRGAGGAEADKLPLPLVHSFSRVAPAAVEQGERRDAV